ncbi:MAG: transposase [Lachnospiraceae bacterium]|nr:transposase [Lachnospiraceae bacterium]
MEFGAKLDMSIDKRGIARLERLSFDAYNESDVLIGTIENYRKRTDPEHILVDQIYRTRENRAYCKSHGIRISGSTFGRPKALTNNEKKQAYADNTDRIEVERGFSLAKRCYGLGLIRTKFDTTTCSSIALSILTMNINHLAEDFLRFLFWTLISMIKWHEKLIKASAFQRAGKIAVC